LGKSTLSTVTQPIESLLRTLAWTVLILCLSFFAGCEKRKLAKPTPQMDAEQQYWVRVLLFKNMHEFKVTAETELVVYDPQRQRQPVRSGNQHQTLHVRTVRGKITVGTQAFESKRIVILPEEPHIFKLRGDEYRGKLEVVVGPDGNSLDLVNVVPLEPYLAGVVGSEMPDYWEPEALKAQAIAARTYCLYVKKRFGSKRDWDLVRTEAHQVYRGVKAESSQIWTAVNQTQGKVLVCEQPGASEGIFPAYYSSTCGGHTENSKNVFGDSFGPLRGVPCPYCKYVAKPRFFFWPMVRYSKKYVSEKLMSRYPSLKALGQIASIAGKEKSNYGNFSRLTKIEITGENGKSDWIRAEDFRLTIDPTGRIIKSAAFEIRDEGNSWAFVGGRGYGHGVGMCQCGAQELARRESNAEEILAYYYPGSKIARLY